MLHTISSCKLNEMFLLTIKHALCVLLYNTKSVNIIEYVCSTVIFSNNALSNLKNGRNN